MNKKINEIIDRINKKIPLDVKDLVVAVGFIATLLVAYAGSNLHSEYEERNTDLRNVIQIESAIEVGEDGIAHTVNYYTETIDPIVYTDETTGETCYAAPAGYVLKYNENGEPICTRTYMEKDLTTADEPKTR